MSIEDTKKAFASRLSQALNALQFAPLGKGRIEQLAKMLQVSKATASKWLNAFSMPTLAKRQILANELGINFKWLESGNGSMKSQTDHSITPQKIPILSLQQIKRLEKALKTPALHYIAMDIPATSQNAFATHLTNETMAPKFPKGTLLIIDPETEVNNGDHVLILLESNKIICRKLNITQNDTYCVPLNTEFEIIKLTKDDKIIGKILRAVVVT